MNYILDTCVISELIKPKTDPRVCSWVEEQNDNHLYLSVITLGEIQKGVSKLEEGVKKSKLQVWLDTELVLRFEGRILGIDDQICKMWGKILAQSEQKGKSLPVIDAMIAATALVNHMAVATRNINDMTAPDLMIINPWESLL